jgi:hypothetical protein
MAMTPYISPIRLRPLPRNMRQHSTPQCRQFKPMDVLRSHNLAKLWADIALLPPLRWPWHHKSPTFDRGLYRRICARKSHTIAIKLSLWMSLAIRILWSYAPSPHQMAMAPYISPFDRGCHPRRVGHGDGVGTGRRIYGRRTRKSWSTLLLRIKLIELETF